ncbi:hypothetical protein MTR67_019970, partial [Solanum verrucosum]
MVPRGVLFSMDGGMGLHSCIAQVDFERKHVGLHLVMMQTQEDSVICVLKFCFIRMLRGLSQHPSQYFRGFIDSQNPGQGFTWGQQWSPSAGPAQ